MPTQLPYHDAHRHLASVEAAPGQSVLNGTTPADWPDLLQVAKTQPRTIAAIGLHPWKVHKAAANWKEHFLETLDRGPRAIGEIGLDGYKDDMEAQIEAFHWQLTQAATRNWPVTIHCLKASDRLLHILKQGPLPERGFHLHAYAGSAEQVRQFADLGAYFSFHAGQLRSPAKKAPTALRAVPKARLLIETDAPDHLDVQDRYEDFLKEGYETAAQIRQVPLDLLTAQVNENFQRFFIESPHR